MITVREGVTRSPCTANPAGRRTEGGRTSSTTRELEHLAIGAKRDGDAGRIISTPRGGRLDGVSRFGPAGRDSIPQLMTARWMAGSSASCRRGVSS